MKRILLILSLVLSMFSLCLFAACGETTNQGGNNEGNSGDGSQQQVEQKCKHSWGTWQNVEEAKCEEAGSRKRVCTLCGNEDVQPIPALGHLFADEYTEDEAPQCNKVGKESKHCLRAGCNAISDERDIPMTDHDWVMSGTVTQPTCIKEGVAEGAKCSFCGATQENTIIPALGHDFDQSIAENVEYVTLPTCTKNGEARVRCTRCDERELQIILATGHNWVKLSESEENDCGGKVCEFYCNIEGCGETKTEVVGGNNHNWSEYIYVSGASCSAYGITEKRVCSKCHGEDVKTTKSDNPRHSRGLDGDPDYFYVLREATEGQDGMVCELCTACGEVILDTAKTIPMLSTQEKITYSVHIVHDNYLSDSFEKECEVSVYDADNKLVQTKTTEKMIATFELDKKEYTVKLSGLPTGYTPAESSYTLTPGKPYVNAFLKGSLQKNGTPERGYYKQGDIARDFTFHDYDGNKYTVSSLLEDHELVAFDYFFTTCSYCLTAFIYEKGMHERFPNIAFVYVNTKQESKEAVMECAETYGFADAIIVDGFDGENEDNLMHAFAPRTKDGVEEDMGNPTRVIIDNEGVITRIVRSDVGGSMPDTYIYILRHMVVLRDELFYPAGADSQTDTTGE